MKTIQRLMMVLMVALLSMTAAAQNAKALYEEGKAFYDAEQYDKAVPKLKAAADKGHKKASTGWACATRKATVSRKTVRRLSTCS